MPNANPRFVAGIMSAMHTTPVLRVAVNASPNTICIIIKDDVVLLRPVPIEVIPKRHIPITSTIFLPSLSDIAPINILVAVRDRPSTNPSTPIKVKLAPIL